MTILQHVGALPDPDQGMLEEIAAAQRDFTAFLEGVHMLPASERDDRTGEVMECQGLFLINAIQRAMNAGISMDTIEQYLAQH